MKHILPLFQLVLVFSLSFNGTQAQTLKDDSLSLVNLYQTTAGGSWTNKTNWLTGNVSTWFGVTVASNRVTVVNLKNNGLTGEITSSFRLSNLRDLYLDNNQITSLDISFLPALRYLYAETGILETLTVNPSTGDYPNLNQLLVRNNKLKTLDISKMPKLDLFYCGNNLLESIKTNSQPGFYPYLRYFYASFNQLTSVNLSNMPTIGRLEVHNNLLATLDISQNTKIFALLANNNFLTLFQTNPSVSYPLSVLYLNNNKLSALDLSNCASLTDVRLQNNFLHFDAVESVVSQPTKFTYSPQGGIELTKNSTNTIFNVSVRGLNNVYQWKKNGAVITGATSSSYSISDGNYKAGDHYQSIITNSSIPGLTISSNVFTLPALVFGQTPDLVVSSDVSICYGTSVELTASATSSLYSKTLSFDGVDDYVQVGDKNSLKMASQMSMEAWIYPTGIGSSSSYGGGIINKEGEYQLVRFPDGTIQWSFANTNPGFKFINTKIIAPLNTWSHVAVTYNAGVIKTFFNGELRHTFNGSGSIGDVYSQGNDFRIGGRQGNTSQYFKGIIDVIRIWNIERTDEQIKNSIKKELPAQSGLVAYWLANKSSASILTDISGSDNNGILTSGATFINANTSSPLISYSWSPGGFDNTSVVVRPLTTTIYSVIAVDYDGASTTKTVTVTVSKKEITVTASSDVTINKGETVELSATVSYENCNSSIVLDGVDDYVQVGDRNSLKMSNQMTIEAWIYPTGVGSSASYGGAIINKEGEYQVVRFPDGTIQWSFGNSNPGWKFINTKIIAPLNTWSHIAVTYSVGEVKTFFNGELAHTYNGSGSIEDAYTSGNDFRIGGRQGTVSHYFKGMIDEIRIWNIARSNEEIFQNRNIIIKLANGLVGYWRFNEGQQHVAFDETENKNNGVLMAGASWSSSSPVIYPPISWSPSVGLSSVSGISIKATPLVTTTYTVSVTDLDGQEKTSSVTITVLRSIQNSDFISNVSGDWNNYKTWKILYQGELIEAAPGELPAKNNSVYIQLGHTVSLSANASCKNLNLNTTADVVRLNTYENTLDVWGKLRLYTGTTFPGTNDPSGGGVPGWITTGTNGRIKLKGTESRIITEKDEFSDHVNLNSWTLECDLAEGVIGTVNSNFRVGNIIITSGNLEVKSKNFRVSK